MQTKTETGWRRAGVLILCRWITTHEI